MFLDEFPELFNRIFFVFCDSCPECSAFDAVARVLHILVFDAPQAFMLFCELEHKVIGVIVKHMCVPVIQATLLECIVSRVAYFCEIRYE